MGLGVAVVPDLSARRTALGQLAVVPLVEPDGSAQSAYIYRSDRVLGTAARKFIETSDEVKTGGKPDRRRAVKLHQTRRDET